MKQMALMIFVICLFLCSCKPDKKDIILERASQYVEQHPDSALNLLHLIDPEMLDDAKNAEYALIEVQAKDKTGADISEKTAIFQARDYFLGTNDPEKTALAYYYSGKVFSERSDHERAMSNYLKANEYVQKTKNKQLQGLIYFGIGYLFYNDTNYEQAIFNFKKAQPLFKQTNHTAYESKSLLMTGNCFYLKENELNKDSAFYMFDRALELAFSKNDSTLICKTLLSKGVMHCKNSDYEQSIAVLYKSLLYSNTKEEKSRNYMYLADTFLQMNEPDSAKYYGKKGLNLLKTIEKLTDDAYIVYMYELLSGIEEQLENYQQALAYKDQSLYYCDSIYSTIIKQKMLAINKKYDKELLLSKSNKWNRTKNICFIVIGLLALCIILILRFLKKQRIEKLQAVRDFHELRQMLKNEERLMGFSERLELIKEIAMLDDMIDDAVRIKELKKRLKDIIAKITWETLFPLLNELHRDVFEKLKKETTNLKEDEFQVLCLNYSMFNNEEIAKILRLKSTTIVSKKTNIRRKLGLENNAGINDFIKNNYFNGPL